MTAKKTPPAPPCSDEVTLVEALRRKEVALAKRRELDYEVAAGKFINAAEIGAEIQTSFRTTAQRLLLLPSKLAPRLAALKTAAECEDLLYRECERALNTLSEEAGAELVKHGAKH